MAIPQSPCPVTLSCDHGSAAVTEGHSVLELDTLSLAKRNPDPLARDLASDLPAAGGMCDRLWKMRVRYWCAVGLSRDDTSLWRQVSDRIQCRRHRRAVQRVT